ncbi:hypothetical protein P1X14_12150 [Sphingomonas sp. AOB5]|uniref:hypothetical protein n=1 Tax=Sphingomonas sp. AOB5 TaxID=3034017 RepID=UPI0023F88E37|nr:hypothetical protein [Sphingomonas sp. AOB5]MDF7776001.1 hypothetical protein [Sphingomonas sp. AOB5]
MKLFLPLAALALAACSSEPVNQTADLPETAPPVATPEPGPSTTPMPEPARYIGRWAATPQLCAGGVWRFEEMDLSTAGEVSCDFHRVANVPGGYDVAATCFAEGNRSEEAIRLRFPANGGGMTVESKLFQPVSLIRCDANKDESSKDR